MPQVKDHWLILQVMHGSILPVTTPFGQYPGICNFSQGNSKFHPRDFKIFNSPPPRGSRT